MTDNYGSMKQYTIYTLTCKDVEVPGIYVGSTSDFAKRLIVHHSDSNVETNKQRKVYKSINSNGGWSNWDFKFLQVLTCTESDARILERFWYDFLKADLNLVRPYITDEERKRENILTSKLFYIENRDHISKYQKQWRTDNQEKIRQYNLANKEKIASHK